MRIDLEQPGSIDLYQLATHVVLPRPIAWVMTDLFLLRAVYAHVADESLDVDGAIDAKRLRVAGKLGGTEYAITDVVRRIPRPA